MNDRLLIITSQELTKLSEEFADEIERKPTCAELFEILTWGIKSCPDDSLFDINPSNIISLQAKLKKGTKNAKTSDHQEEIESAVAELNDNVFVLATGLLSTLSSLIKSDTGQEPTLAELCNILVAGLHTAYFRFMRYRYK